MSWRFTVEERWEFGGLGLRWYVEEVKDVMYSLDCTLQSKGLLGLILNSMAKDAVEC